MSRKYQHAGLTEELFQRLVSEYTAIRAKYGRGFNEHIRKIKNCSKEGLGRNKPTVKHYLYRAYMLGV